MLYHINLHVHILRTFSSRQTRKSGIINQKNEELSDDRENDGWMVSETERANKAYLKVADNEDDDISNLNSSVVTSIHVNHTHCHGFPW
jgi:hypothetical protein